MGICSRIRDDEKGFTSLRKIVLPHCAHRCDIDDTRECLVMLVYLVPVTWYL